MIACKPFSLLLLVLFLVFTTCKDHAGVLDLIYSKNRSGSEKILFDQTHELDGTLGDERIILSVSGAEERFVLLDQTSEGLWQNTAFLDLKKASTALEQPGIPEAHTALKIEVFSTGGQDPDSVLLEYLADHADFEKSLRQISIFTRLTRTFDSQVVSGFNKYKKQISAAGGVPYRIVQGQGPILFPDSSNKTDMLELRYNGRSFAWLYDDGPFFYFSPVQARKEDKRLKGSIKIKNIGSTTANVRLFVEMPPASSGPGGLTDLMLFEAGRMQKDEEETFEFDTRLPSKNPSLFIRVISGRKDDYEFPASGESADLVTEKMGERFYIVPLSGL